MSATDERTNRARTPMPEAGPADRPARTGPGRRRARTLRWLRSVVLGLLAMFLALLVTPEVSVSTFGQTVQVGAVRPPAALAWSGPGEADLFGEGPVATVLRFDGFIRPLIVWQRFAKGQAATEFLQSSATHTGRSTGTDISRVGQRPRLRVGAVPAPTRARRRPARRRASSQRAGRGGARPPAKSSAARLRHRCARDRDPRGAPDGRLRRIDGGVRLSPAAFGDLPRRSGRHGPARAGPRRGRARPIPMSASW